MSEMGKTVIKTIGSLKVTCHELSVGELRGVLARRMTDDLLGEALFHEITLADLPVFTSLTAEQIEACKPSALEEVIAGCREANKSFFDLMVRLAQARNPS
ncbi:hypothetical protein [Pseudomonas sp. ML96]|uniref:hypothetical protein n=1 Tax=Pseudomonas sp. ML96 TaxID=1523503 RepID=UPI0005BC8874|nr:hypothetical protein [Pseudomonas sp. ML96]